jgi:hypothetical protein
MRFFARRVSSLAGFAGSLREPLAQKTCRKKPALGPAGLGPGKPRAGKAGTDSVAFARAKLSRSPSEISDFRGRLRRHARLRRGTQGQYPRFSAIL